VTAEFEVFLQHITKTAFLFAVESLTTRKTFALFWLDILKLPSQHIRRPKVVAV